jgi:hypothetical protein
LRNAKQRFGQLILGKIALFLLAETARQRQLALFLALSVISLRAARNNQAAIFSTGCSTRMS